MDSAVIELLADQAVWDAGFEKWFSFLRVSQRPIESPRRFARVGDQALAALLAGVGFRKCDELGTDSAPLPRRIDGDLPHLHHTATERLEDQCGDEYFAIERGKMMPERFVGEIGGAPWNS